MFSVTCSNCNVFSGNQTEVGLETDRIHAEEAWIRAMARKPYILKVIELITFKEKFIVYAAFLSLSLEIFFLSKSARDVNNLGINCIYQRSLR